MVRLHAERGRGLPLEDRFDGGRRLSLGQAGAVRDTKDVRVDRKSFRTQRDVQHDIGGLAPDTGERLEHVAIGRHPALMLFDEQARQRDDILCLGVEQADRLDMRLQRVLAERDHLVRRLDRREQRARRLVHPRVGRLRRQHDRNQQLIDVAIGEFGFGGRIGFGETAIEFEDVGPLHRPRTSAIA